MSEQLDIMEQYPVLPTRSAILLPGVQAPLEVGRSTSVNAVEAAERDGVPVLVVPQRDPDTQSPSPMSLHEVGVLADVVAVEKNGPRRYTVTLRGRSRYMIDSYEATSPYLIANASPFPPGPGLEDPEVFALVTELKIPLAAVLADRSGDEEAEDERIAALDDPEDLLSEAVGLVELTRDNELKLLCETDTAERLRTVLPIISRLHQVLLVKASIDAQLSSDISRGERERVLRDRMRAIKEELGEADVDSDLDELRERMDDSKMPDEVRTAAKRQLARMGHMSTSSPEYNVARTYLETLLDIPWGEYTKDTLDVAAARAILEADHAGLEKVKKRILEFIAVRKLAPDKQGPILCLVGPPGVGKTSLGRSIATSLGRKYVRISLGGVRDESEIRGHRRTYIGALPGRIANGLKKAGAMNPVFVLDEIDKLGGGMRGDPSAALLEVLDPEQNNSFSDHYLEVDLDLSRIMFLATANQLETIPAALLDRMEIIRLPGYTIEEKREIARQHLLPKQIVEHGLGRDQVIVDDEALDDVITRYTREAGVRNLERELAALCRHAAVEIAGGTAAVAHIGKDDLSEPLGPPRYFSEVADRHPEVGISTGLAWTPTGGDIMFIEARSMPGKGDLKLTGQLGDVMSESAAAAYSWVRANADRLEIEPSRFTALDIHMHIPSGAVRKDGPSAGIAISTALVSLLSDKPVRSDVAITGEITLRGLSLPVGGIKEKVLAAHRAGIKVVLLPERNRKDIEDIPQEVRDTLDIRFVKKVDEALVIALGRAGDTAPAAAAPIPVVPPPTVAVKSPGQVFPS